MIELFTSYFGGQNIRAVYRMLITVVIVITTIIMAGLWMINQEHTGFHIITFLMVAAASFSGGSAIGFLFGIPKSGKIPQGLLDSSNKDINNAPYTDNTNLEEISDWITKIIVGISFINFRTVLQWLNEGAQTVAHSLGDGSNHINYFVFSYGLIIFYFITGSGLLYLWSRTTLSIILTKMKQLETENKNLKKSVQGMANTPEDDPFSNSKSILETSTPINSDLPAVKDPATDNPTDLSFRNTTELLYKNKKITDKEDLQKGRWGGKSTVQNITLEASYDASNSFLGLYGVTLQVRSLDTNKPLQGEVAFFLHDTFPNPISYAAVNASNVAQIKVKAWEAFVVGARTEDGTELELDLNKVKGFPNDFYWK